MNQVSNSLLTLLSTPFSMTPFALAPRENASADGRHFTPFFAFPGDARKCCLLFPGLSCPPRSLVRSWLGEGRIRNLFHGMCLALLGMLFLFGLVRATMSAERLVINLKEAAAIASDKVYLKDIAELRGPDAGQLERLAQIPIGFAPAFGETIVLSRHQISTLVENTIGRTSSGIITGAAVVQIRLQGREIGTEEIASLLKLHLLDTTPWKDSEIEIHSIGNLSGIEIPQENTVLRISSDAAILGQRRILAPIEILHSGKSLRSIWITAEIDIHSEVLTAAIKIPAGKTITTEDVAQKSVRIKDFRASYVRIPQDILGKVARRSIAPGDPLTREKFSDPLLVNSGETVRLRLERNGIVLTSLAKAEQDGRLGQMIRVRNIDFSTLLKARVTGRAEVRMQ
jgi:flagella basal body P-ring formation protein FlgA